MKKPLLFAIGLLWASSALSQAVTTTKATVVPNAAAYSSGQCLGGVLAVSGMVRVQGPGGTIIADIDITDTSGTNAAIDVLVFDALPSGTYTDRVACTIAAADQSHLVGLIPNTIFTCALDGTSATGICRAAPALFMTPAALPVTSSALWFLPVIRATPTYGAAKSLYFAFKALPD